MARDWGAEMKALQQHHEEKMRAIRLWEICGYAIIIAVTLSPLAWALGARYGL